MSVNAEATTPHLNNLGLEIRQIDGKGRGVLATRDLPLHTLLEISPVILFTPDEYNRHGRHTILDEYTFSWPGRDGRMALALGIGSLFNHSSTPNVSYVTDKATNSIRFTTSRSVQAGEELCIFYSHELWFDDRSNIEGRPVRRNGFYEYETSDIDIFGGLSKIEVEREMDQFVDDELLPFEEVQYLDEDDGATMHTMNAWVVDIPDPRSITSLLDYIRESGLDTPDLQHLKRVRKVRMSSPDLQSGANLEQQRSTLLLSLTRPLLFSPPCSLPEPYLAPVPTTPARTLEEVALKSRIWPTTYQPRKRDRDVRSWTRGEVKWIERSIARVWEEGKLAQKRGEIPIVSYIPSNEQSTKKGVSTSDTRNSLGHPLRHSVMNILRRVSDISASCSSSPGSLSPVTNGFADSSVPSKNGQHYLLTSQTLFTTHEPCIMCSMALLHSRVKQIFYIYPMPATGGCGGITSLPGLKGVNHRFEIWRWKDPSTLGTELEVERTLDA